MKPLVLHGAVYKCISDSSETLTFTVAGYSGAKI